MKNLGSLLLIVSIILQTAAFADTTPTVVSAEQEMALECGSDKVCRSAFQEQVLKEESELFDLAILEAEFLSGEKSASPTIATQPLLVRRPARPSGPRP